MDNVMSEDRLDPTLEIREGGVSMPGSIPVGTQFIGFQLVSATPAQPSNSSNNGSQQ